jgi:hypothetical protein
MLVADLKDRGVPWARLLVAQGSALTSKVLNLKTREKICTVLVWAMLLLTAGAVGLDKPLLLFAAAVCVTAVLILNRSLYAFFERVRGFWFALGVIPLHVLYYCLNGVAAGYGWFLHELLGGPAPDPTVEAFAEVGLKTWPPVPVKRRADWW